jgi:hypothetical protein
MRRMNALEGRERILPSRLSTNLMTTISYHRFGEWFEYQTGWVFQITKGMNETTRSEACSQGTHITLDGPTLYSLEYPPVTLLSWKLTVTGHTPLMDTRGTMRIKSPVEAYQ